MRVGVYGLPCAGKTTLLDRVDFAPVLSGSRLLRQLDPGFSRRSPEERDALRRRLALQLRERETFLMDGHCIFGDQVVFTEEDGALYDAVAYLYIDPAVLRERMLRLERNREYAAWDPAAWQAREIRILRTFCREHDRDFYVLDCPPENVFTDLQEPLDFLREVLQGDFGCVRFARACAEEILARDGSPALTLTDGDRTLILEDSSAAVLGYATHIFDGNFYTGYQSWRQGRDFRALAVPAPDQPLPVTLSARLLKRLDREHTVILTAGHPALWGRIAGDLGMPCFRGCEMSADTKYFITKFLQAAGRTVTAYGDSLGDYGMLRQADRGFLAARPDGSVSRSLKGLELGGVELV